MTAAQKGLRIVHALPFFDPATQFGGPIAQLREVCRGLAGRGHDVKVVTTALGIGNALPRERWVARDGYQVWYSRVNRLGAVAPYFAPRVERPLQEALDDADVLHLALSFTHLNIVARRVALAHHVPYVYTPRSCLDPVRLRHRRVSKIAFLRLFERRILRDAALIHALTEAEKDQVLRRAVSPSRVVVIPNATELQTRTTWPDAAVFRERFNLGQAPFVLFMGRLHSIKGLDLLVRSFAEARSSGVEARLVIAGPDEGGTAIVGRWVERLGLGEDVLLTGRLDGELRLAALRAAEVFALTSYSEGMPNAVLEACAAGTPVVITDRCNLPEVAEWKAGRVEPPDVGRLADAMRSLLSDRALCAEMGANARRMVDERFAPPIVLDQIESMYERLLREREAGAHP